ncbi:MAG: amidohydrolase family protein [Planctomycetes bacterium]|nr:amidohydrolase family protein [Planctomycetota bacterium]
MVRALDERRGARPRPALARVAALALVALASCASSANKPDLSPLGPGEEGWALRCDKILTADADDNVYSSGLILVRGSKIAYVGPNRAIPAGYKTLEGTAGVAAPGMVDLHSHIHSGGFGDVNDMVLPVNPELRAASALRPSNSAVKIACAGGVTTLYGIPGSGTSLSGFGLIYKTKTNATYDETVVQTVGGMKIAQSYNPERGAGDLGQTRAGLSWILEDVNEKAIGATRQGRKDRALENLQKIHSKELPVLIHCAGSDGFTAASRMWKEKYDTRCVLSHGCFDAHKTAQYIVAAGAPINAGPRMIDFFSTRDGAITGVTGVYERAGAKDLSVCTDSPVMPQEELFLQGAMSARYGAEGYNMLRATTINPARAFGIDARVGSLEVGKDADIVIRSGDPLDPRSRVELVLIDGRVQYDRRRDGQWF